VPVLRSGVFAGRNWIATTWGGHDGWIVAAYVTAA
jgi:N-acetylmuramoyl-L-alanine amidase